jgi:quercetin dioxygenase-like cupin family protein
MRTNMSDMSESMETGPSRPSVLYVASGQDRFGEQWGLGVSSIDFKVTTQDSGGDLFILENTFHAKGGPARHLHYDQDEWFCALEGEFVIEVGQQRFRLLPGDSLLAPRRIPHVWAHVGDSRGRILIVFQPAGQTEAFFRKVTQANAMPPQDPALWRAHGMELLGASVSALSLAVRTPVHSPHAVKHG